LPPAACVSGLVGGDRLIHELLPHRIVGGQPVHERQRVDLQAERDHEGARNVMARVDAVNRWEVRSML
jgi:hypothetical protein